MGDKVYSSNLNRKWSLWAGNLSHAYVLHDAPRTVSAAASKRAATKRRNIRARSKK